MNRPHRGFALLAILVLLSTFSAVMLVNRMRNANEGTDMRAQRETLRTLRDAQLALIAYGLIEDNTPGSLPCPSTPGTLDGKSTIVCDGTPGTAPSRLPWHRMGLQRPQDGNGECLWYAVYAPYRNNIATSVRSEANGNAINPDLIGQMMVTDSGTSVGYRSVAVLFAPGQALVTQTGRGAGAVAQCGSGAVEEFLDSQAGLDNADSSGNYGMAASSNSFNDTVLPISHEQILKPVLRRTLTALSRDAVRSEIVLRGGGGSVTLETLRGNTPAMYQSFDLLVANPIAPTTLNYAGTCPGVSNGTTTYKHAVSWLCFNNWYKHIKYDGSLKSLTIALNPAQPMGYRCSMNIDTGQITCSI